MLFVSGLMVTAHAADGPPRPLAPRTQRGAPKAPPPGAGAPGREHAAPPEVTVIDESTVAARVHAARGRSLFVHLWASWCAPCLQELPTIDLFARAARARGATFLSFSLDDVRRAGHVGEVLRQRAPNLTRLVAQFDDADRFMAIFSPKWEGSIPALFGYDADGRLAGALLGEPDIEELDQLLEQLTAPVVVPRAPMAPAARYDDELVTPVRLRNDRF